MVGKVKSVYSILSCDKVKILTVGIIEKKCDLSVAEDFANTVLDTFNELLVGPALANIKRHQHAVISLLDLFTAFNPACEYL